MGLHTINFFATNNSVYLAEKIVAEYGSSLGSSQVLNFSDIELLLMVDAEKRASERRVIAVMTSPVSIGAKLATNLLRTAGM